MHTYEKETQHKTVEKATRRRRRKGSKRSENTYIQRGEGSERPGKCKLGGSGEAPRRATDLPGGRVIGRGLMSDPEEPRGSQGRRTDEVFGKGACRVGG